MSAGFIGTIRLSPFPGRSRRRRHCCPSAIGTIRRSPHCRNSSDTSRSAGGAGEGPRVRRRRPGRVGGAPGRLAAGLCRRAARPRGGRHHRRRCARRPICAGTPRSGRQPCRLYRRRSGRERARPCLEDQLRCRGAACRLLRRFRCAVDPSIDRLRLGRCQARPLPGGRSGSPARRLRGEQGSGRAGGAGGTRPACHSAHRLGLRRPRREFRQDHPQTRDARAGIARRRRSAGRADRRRRSRRGARRHRRAYRPRRRPLGHVPSDRRRCGELARFCRGDRRSGRPPARPAPADRADRQRRIPGGGAPPGELAARLRQDRGALRRPASTLAGGAGGGPRRAGRERLLREGAMKGIILAGGHGTRLYPMTLAVSKQLLPVYDKPMIYYPLTTLMLAGIRELLIITAPSERSRFEELLGDGGRWGLAISYAVQPKPEGIAQALLRQAPQRDRGAPILPHQVRDPQAYGVVAFDAAGRAVEIIEKPRRQPSHWAVTGLYFYDEAACDLAASLTPSARGELEITDLNALYLRRGGLTVERLGRGFAWFDTGTPDSLLEAAEFVRTIELRQGLKIACVEEVAYRLGWIDRAHLLRLARALGSCAYARYLEALPEAAELR